MLTRVRLPLLLRLVASRSGATAVEFALLAPIYLLLLLGMVAYGIYFGASHSVQQLAADAARASIAGLDPADRAAIATRFIDRNAQGYVFIDPARLSVQVADSVTDDTQFDVELTFDASGLPIWSLMHGIALPERAIARRSTIRIGGL